MSRLARVVAAKKIRVKEKVRYVKEQVQLAKDTCLGVVDEER